MRFGRGGYYFELGFWVIPRLGRKGRLKKASLIFRNQEEVNLAVIFEWEVPPGRKDFVANWV